MPVVNGGGQGEPVAVASSPWCLDLQQPGWRLGKRIVARISETPQEILTESAVSHIE